MRASAFQALIELVYVNVQTGSLFPASLHQRRLPSFDRGMRVD